MAFKVGGSSDSIIRSLFNSTKKTENSFAKLSSGNRITKASIDPAGLAVATSLLSEASVLQTANRNIDYGISASQIADGATDQLGGITTRLQELATQSANGTLSDEQRASIATEFDSLKQEAERIVATTEFNGQSLLSGGGLTVQAGVDGSENSQIDVENIDVNSELSSQGFSSLSINDQSSALAAIDSLSNVTSSLSQVRGNLGAATSRLEVAKDNNTSREVAVRESAARITDVDVAKETADLTANKIRQEVSTALSAQAANLNRSAVLSLLS